ncbi:nodulation efficiency protein D (NfeD) [Campylobacter blaseri]|uniref:Nodulation efficiency protein D (NfeD) n=2 Tax=Campylobacter blaseri TaxID=2042961 RepID=A0A2P8R047_9BACT|nr:nodulation efficiency protein D (NfeD) [Campylobacter blaseri]PSM53655.1 nodulation efficiency protein D (NfeD) [Campylobacter blaseri]
MLDPINLFIIAAICLAFELMIANFILIFFGLGFFIVGILSFFIKISWEWQMLIAFVLSLVLMFVLKKPFKRWFHRYSEEIKDNYFDEEGVGEIKNGMVYYKGTFWQSDDIAGLEEGAKVEVLGVKDSKIKIKR